MGYTTAKKIAEKNNMTIKEAEEVILEVGKIQLDFIAKNLDNMPKDTASFIVAIMDGDKVHILAEWLKDKNQKDTDAAAVAFITNTIAAVSDNRLEVESLFYQWLRKK